MEKDSKNQRRQSKQFTTTNESTSNESSLKSSGKRITNEISKFELKIGLLVEAKDSANNWYKSRIIKLDQEANRCKVHFLGWNSRYDQWFDFDSNDLRICSDQTQTNEIASHENSNEPTKPKQNSRESAQFKTGDLVLAKWTDECFYQARIARVTYKNDQLYYEVKFYDGIKKLLRSQFVRVISEEEAKTLGIETDAISNIEIPVQEAQVTKHNEPQEKPTNEQEEDKRRQDAELLLLMQNAQVTENEPSNEPKPIEKTNEAQATEKEQIETKEEKPETTENIKPIETPCTPLATTVATKNTSNTSSDIRKSLRVKRLRTFTEEIVFDSPASSITYNLASISSPVVASSSNLAVSNPKRRKVENTDQSLPPEQVSEANENSKQNIKHEKKKEKTEDLIKETLKLAKNKHSKLKLDQMKLEEKNKNEKKKENKKPKEKEKQNQAKLEEEETPNKKRKKKKKDKKELLKKLIETSQQQLRQQQMLIEKELEKKTQKKLRKLLRKQEFALQQQIQQNTLSIFLNNQLIREQFQSNNIMLNSPTTNLMKNSQSTFNKVPKTPTPTPNPSFYNLLNSNTETVEQIQLQTGKLESQRSSSEPIKCTFANCDKTFRKQSLLDYHIKYYHYANQTSESNPTTTALSNQTVLDENDKNLNETETKLPTALSNQTITQPRKRRIQSNSNTTKQATCREDPYEVIHCKCAQNINRGFMIQCDVCLCWQHGDCEMIAKASDVPKRYYCWICKNPGNKLKKLKYENWIVNSLSENSITSDEEPFVVNREQLDSLNDCSRRYYNLNLLMFTLEHQMSMLNRITKENDFVLVDSNDEFEKLVQNVTHLQESLIKLFNEFNQQVDGLYSFLII
jgi:hypothetical protein